MRRLMLLTCLAGRLAFLPASTIQCPPLILPDGSQMPVACPGGINDSALLSLPPLPDLAGWPPLPDLPGMPPLPPLPLPLPTPPLLLPPLPPLIWPWIPSPLDLLPPLPPLWGEPALPELPPLPQSFGGTSPMELPPLPNVARIEDADPPDHAPEPTTFALIGAGLLALGWKLRRQSGKSPH